MYFTCVTSHEVNYLFLLILATKLLTNKPDSLLILYKYFVFTKTVKALK